MKGARVAAAERPTDISEMSGIVALMERTKLLLIREEREAAISRLVPFVDAEASISASVRDRNIYRDGIEVRPTVSFGVGAEKASTLEELRKLLDLRTGVHIDKRGISHLLIAKRTDLIDFVACFDNRLQSKQAHMEELKAMLKILERRAGLSHRPSVHRIEIVEDLLNHVASLRALNRGERKHRGMSVEEISTLKQGLASRPFRPKKPEKKSLLSRLIAQLGRLVR